MKIGDDRPAGRRRALVAHARLADRRRRAAAAGARDHRPTGGNVVVEEAMDGVIASVKRGGTIAAPLAQAPIFPTMVTHMVGVGEETGALDAMLDRDRRVLRGTGRSVGQGADLDPRADHDHRDRRHRRLHRDLDVPAAVRSLQPHPVGLAALQSAKRPDLSTGCQRERRRAPRRPARPTAAAGARRCSEASSGRHRGRCRRTRRDDAQAAGPRGVTGAPPRRSVGITYSASPTALRASVVLR